MNAGSRLGPYDIFAPLGAGGMGEVWRARDTRLDREVAIKVLPPDAIVGANVFVGDHRVSPSGDLIAYAGGEGEEAPEMIVVLNGAQLFERSPKAP